MEKEAKIYVAGHRGMVGSSIVRQLLSRGYANLILRTSTELDLRNQQAVNDFFEKAIEGIQLLKPHKDTEEAKVPTSN